MKKNLKKWVKRVFISLFLFLFIYLIYDFVVFFFSIESYILKYDIYIPMGSFDAYEGGAERILENEEIDIYNLYYTRNVDYLIKKYNFIETELDDGELVPIIEKIESNISFENKEKIEEYLQTLPKDCYYIFIESEEGKLLLFLDKGYREIYSIENKVFD